ncbi:hypothetical protein PR202_ga31061 [Eleusine coracana subsp. coracana]|uniref:RNase H type-1 domain-containing protein n=1 Tax=Eleusine coracana subsp. coracana TaxID=191504 RepID=A0AAV5DR03_ELECO|nr:hypothetical protein PR202_ga31061 [Eleusine coracana subsp. coracana]
MSVIIRDEHKKALLTSWRAVFDGRSAKEVEVNACKKGLMLAREWERKKAILESDCLTLITSLNMDGSQKSALWYLVQEVKEIGSELAEVIFRSAKRERNRVAHELAWFGKRSCHTVMHVQ